MSNTKAIWPGKKPKRKAISYATIVFTIYQGWDKNDIISYVTCSIVTLSLLDKLS